MNIIHCIYIYRADPGCVPPLAVEVASLAACVDHSRPLMPDYQPT